MHFGLWLEYQNHFHIAVMVLRNAMLALKKIFLKSLHQFSSKDVWVSVHLCRLNKLQTLYTVSLALLCDAKVVKGSPCYLERIHAHKHTPFSNINNAYRKWIDFIQRHTMTANVFVLPCTFCRLFQTMLREGKWKTYLLFVSMRVARGKAILKSMRWGGCWLLIYLTNFHS